MDIKISHHDVNARTQFAVDREKHEVLKRKFTPKTKIQRLKGVFWMLTIVWVLCQVVSALLASTGFIQFALDNLENKSFAIPFVMFCCLFLEWSFNKLNRTIAEQKNDDKTPVSKILYGLILIFGCFYAGVTFFGSPYSVSFFASKPDYHDIDNVSMKQDKIITSDSLFWAKQIDKQNASIASYVTMHSKYDSKIDTIRLRSSAVKGHRKMCSKRDSLDYEYLASASELRTNKAKVLEEAHAENKEMEQEFNAWINSFGFSLSLISLVCIFIFLPCFHWCEKYKRDEVSDNESILAEIEEAKQKEEVKTHVVRQEVEVVSEEEVLVDEEVNNMQFSMSTNKEEGKEYAIVVGEGRKHNRIIGKVDGELRELLLGDLNRHIREAKKVKESTVLPYYESLKSKLVNYKK